MRNRFSLNGWIAVCTLEAPSPREVLKRGGLSEESCETASTMDPFLPQPALVSGESDILDPNLKAKCAILELGQTAAVFKQTYLQGLASRLLLHQARPFSKDMFALTSTPLPTKVPAPAKPTPESVCIQYTHLHLCTHL